MKTPRRCYLCGTFSRSYSSTRKIVPYRDEHWWILEINQADNMIWGCRRCDKVLLYEREKVPNIYPVGRCPKRKPIEKEPWGGRDRWPNT